MLLLSLGNSLCAATEVQEQKIFQVQPGGRLILDVDFGAIQVIGQDAQELSVDVWRRVRESSKAKEEDYFRSHPVLFSQQGTDIVVRVEVPSQVFSSRGWSWWGRSTREARYVIRLPKEYSIDLKTRGGGIQITDLNGKMDAETHGGSIELTRTQGQIYVQTSGGRITANEVQGNLNLRTSGGSIQVRSGEGILEGRTSGGAIDVEKFAGSVDVRTSGGSIRLDSLTSSQVRATTSGGSIRGDFLELPTDGTDLRTAGGSIRLKLPSSAAFELDATTSGGSCSTEFPIIIHGKPSKSKLSGSVQGGGPSVVLKTSGGSISVDQGAIAALR
jgi:DUF4097 and DUF4098 domain-containing protein YvlB